MLKPTTDHSDSLTYSVDFGRDKHVLPLVLPRLVVIRGAPRIHVAIRAETERVPSPARYLTRIGKSVDQARRTSALQISLPQLPDRIIPPGINLPDGCQSEDVRSPAAHLTDLLSQPFK